MHRLLELVISLILPFWRVEKRPAESPILRVSMLASGKVLLDGKEATVSQAGRALERTKGKKGSVWYYRERGKGEPPPEAVELFKMMVENKLSISLSSKADFSDYLDEEGYSHPRK